MKFQEIDHARSELRFFVILPFLGFLLEKLQEKFEKKVFSRNEVVQTVYLGNIEQVVPGGTSFKARRYLPDFSDRISLSPSDKFLFEMKRHKDSECWHYREKAPREETSLGEMIATVSSQCQADLRPYVVAEYHRRHFLPVGATIPLRITVDTGMRYWFVGEERPYLMRTDSEIARVECKVGKGYADHFLLVYLLNILFSLGAKPIFSKKDEAYNLVKKYYDGIYARPLVKELTDCEIEAKFNLHDPDPVGFFRKLKAELEGKNIPISIVPSYPFTFKTSSLNHYWGQRKGSGLRDGLKILFKGLMFKSVTKGAVSVLDSDLAIIKRREVKGRKISYSPEIFQRVIDWYASQLGQLEYVGYLSRGRRAIWPEHRETGRMYHVSLDRCLASGKQPLYQLEIEYSGILEEKARGGGSSLAEEEIIRDTQLLAREILAFAKREGIALVPDKLSKFEWLTT